MMMMMMVDDQQFHGSLMGRGLFSNITRVSCGWMRIGHWWAPLDLRVAIWRDRDHHGLDPSSWWAVRPPTRKSPATRWAFSSFKLRDSNLKSSPPYNSTSWGVRIKSELKYVGIPSWVTYNHRVNAFRGTHVKIQHLQPRSSAGKWSITSFTVRRYYSSVILAEHDHTSLIIIRCLVVITQPENMPLNQPTIPF